jgi:hypothetical protein
VSLDHPTKQGGRGLGDHLDVCAGLVEPEKQMLLFVRVQGLDVAENQGPLARHRIGRPRRARMDRRTEMRHQDRDGLVDRSTGAHEEHVRARAEKKAPIVHRGERRDQPAFIGPKYCILCRSQAYQYDEPVGTFNYRFVESEEPDA